MRSIVVIHVMPRLIICKVRALHPWRRVNNQASDHGAEIEEHYFDGQPA
jgi:hypothetical protein